MRPMAPSSSSGPSSTSVIGARKSVADTALRERPTVKTRIYILHDGQKDRLIRAPNQAQALRHAARHFKVSVPTQDQLYRFAAEGVKVEESGEGSE